MNAVPMLPSWNATLHRYWPGLLLSVVIAIASAFIAEQRGGPTLLYAVSYTHLTLPTTERV